MTLASIDLETQGLNAQRFITGTIIREDTQEPELFTNKRDMWDRIIELGEQYGKRKKKGIKTKGN